MFDQPLELSDVLRTIRRADESLYECIAPLWPGVRLIAAWMEGKSKLLWIDEVPADEGFFLLTTSGNDASVVRPANDEEIQRFLQYLPKANIILLEDGLAFPGSFAERLQGITGPRPIHFAMGDPLTPVLARFDGMNLLYDGLERKASHPLADLLGSSSIFTPGEFLSTPGTVSAIDEARAAQADLRAHPHRIIEIRITAVLAASGANLRHWEAVEDRYRVEWQKAGTTHEVMLSSISAPITSGISLAGAHGFDPSQLTRLLTEHALDTWT